MQRLIAMNRLFVHGMIALIVLALPTHSTSAADKPFQDIQNTQQFYGSPIKKGNVHRLEMQWFYETTVDSPLDALDGNIDGIFKGLTGDMPVENTGPIPAAPAVAGDYVYFNDSSGFITKLNRFTGQTGTEGWKKSYPFELSVPGFTLNGSRNTPLIVGDLVIVGSNLQLFEPLCVVIGVPINIPLICHLGDGAEVLALNKYDGAVVWRKKVDTHGASKITGSISLAGDKLIVPVAHWEEDWARGYPNVVRDDDTGQWSVIGAQYQCCSARGSVVALDVKTGAMLWKTYTAPGDGSKIRVIGDEIDDPDNATIISLADVSGLTQQAIDLAMRATVQDDSSGTNPDGFWGTSVYGHNPTVDRKRNRVYVGISQNELAPEISERCEKARRKLAENGASVKVATAAEVPGLPAGLTCANLNQQLHNYGNSIIALDLDDGEVEWQFLARRYDAWHHGCGAPDFYGDAFIMPLLFPVPFQNAANCNQDPVGPDLGFGQHPVLIENVHMAKELRDSASGKPTRSLVIGGNKDGRLFAIDADSGELVWEVNADPGGILGGLQWGIASDGKNIYFTTRNSKNSGRAIKDPYVPATDWLGFNGFTDLGVRTGPFLKEDGAAPREYPAPGTLQLPFPGPNRVFAGFGVSEYPDLYAPLGATPPAEVHPLCNPLFGFSFDGCIKGPISGPSEMWTLVNPPEDTVIDDKSVFVDRGKLKTIAGMVQAVDASRGEILWQRPANDGFLIGEELGQATTDAQLTVGNGIVLVGYADKRGTFVGLHAKDGRKLFQFNSVNPGGETYGLIQGSPLVVKDWVYLGIGSDTGIYFADKLNRWRGNSYGNRLYAFKLPSQEDDDVDEDDDP
jgi:outer membrane protein assembly factor BamB